MKKVEGEFKILRLGGEELKKLVESSVQSLATVPEKERRLSVVLQD